MTDNGASSNSAFDDVDQLSDALADARAADTQQLSTVSDALAIVDAFRRPPAPAFRTVALTTGASVVIAGPQSPWISLDRATVADGLATLVQNPRSISQSMLNLCGPAVFFVIVAGRHPVAVAHAAAALFNAGQCDLGGLHLQPRVDLMTANYAAMAKKMSDHNFMPATQVVWMLLGALRNTMAVWWSGDWVGDPDQALAGMTRPEEVGSWLRSTGFFCAGER